nr:MAG: hypothetical protein [Bacteriophage sp.]
MNAILRGVVAVTSAIAVGSLVGGSAAISGAAVTKTVTADRYKQGCVGVIVGWIGFYASGVITAAVVWEATAEQ